MYVKRVIAAGGSRVSIADCMAIVDGNPLFEPYVVVPGAEMLPQCTFDEVVVPQVAGWRLTNRWSVRVRDTVPSPYVGVRVAQLNR
jgi:hypothetical protein